jgi:DNA topoisomerase IB
MSSLSTATLLQTVEAVTNVAIVVDNILARLADSELAENVFCPTGKGGGKDPTCGKGSARGDSSLGTGSSSTMDSPSFWKTPQEVSRAIEEGSAATLEEIRDGKVTLISLGDPSKFSPSTVAQYQAGAGRVIVTEKFFEDDEFGRKVTLAHEFGHEVSRRALSGGTASEATVEALRPFRKDPENPWNYDNFAGFSSRPDEMLADVYAGITMSSDKPWEEERGRFAGVYKHVIAVSRRAGLPLPEWSESVNNAQWVDNVFCPTGKGGGKDPTCSPGGEGRGPLFELKGGKPSVVYHGATLLGGLRAAGFGIEPPKEGASVAGFAFSTDVEGTAVNYGKGISFGSGTSGYSVVVTDMPQKIWDRTALDPEEHGTSREDIIDTISGDRGRAFKTSLRVPRSAVREVRFYKDLDDDVPSFVFKKGDDILDAENTVRRMSSKTSNVFCPTGAGGGVDPTCSPGSITTKRGETLVAASYDKEAKQWLVEGKSAPEHVQKSKTRTDLHDVYMNMDPKGTLISQGLDSKDRTQSKYSSSHDGKSAAAKFGRTRELIKKRKEILQETKKDSKDPKLRENADALRTVLVTGIRPGSDQDTKADFPSYGATTLLGKHVVSKPDGSVSLDFVTGKSKGKSKEFPVTDDSVSRMLVMRAKVAGPDGSLFDTDAASLRRYSKNKDGGGFKTKDFRTALATETAISEVKRIGIRKKFTSKKEYREAVNGVGAVVSNKIGNTPAMALKAYIDPQVFVGWKPPVSRKK